MNLQELLAYFNESDTIGENKEAVDMMRECSRQAQKITMKINSIDNIGRYIHTECLTKCAPLISTAYDPSLP